jgi:hypothetical protein
MTTVAFDGRYLAADTMGHRSGVPSNTLTPKIAVRDGFAYAINGSWMPMINVLIEWHRAGAKFNEFPEIKTGGGMMIVELAMRRVWLVSGEVPAPDEEAAPITAGSGGDIALGALHAGKTAMEAVQIAAKCDIHTNDIIDFVDLLWPEKGVQRWDGTMPSRDHPMPVTTERLNVDDLTERFEVKDGPKSATVDYDILTDKQGVHEYTELRTGRHDTRADAEADLRTRLREFLSHHDGGTLMWRVRPEISWDRFMRHEQRTVWSAYARLAVVRSPMTGLKVRACIKRGTNSHTWVEHDPECDGTCGDQRVRGPITSVPDGGLKAEAHTLVDSYCEQDEEGRLRLVAHELTHMHNGRPLTTKADLCMHGFVRSTCSRCKHETYPYPAA